MDKLTDIIKQLELLAQDLELQNTSESIASARLLRKLIARLFGVADTPCDCGMY